MISTKVAVCSHVKDSAARRFNGAQGSNTNHLSHQHAGHSQTPVAQYGAQLGPEEHFECHAHPLNGMCILGL